jgi:hypothetical protein
MVAQSQINLEDMKHQSEKLHQSAFKQPNFELSGINLRQTETD